MFHASNGIYQNLHVNIFTLPLETAFLKQNASKFSSTFMTFTCFFSFALF